MFGPTSNPWDEANNSIDNQAAKIAQLGAGYAAGSLAGRGMTQALGGLGLKPASVERAETLKEALEAARDPMGDMLTTYKNLAEELHRRGLVEEAMKAEQMYEEAKTKKLDSDMKREGIAASVESRRAAADKSRMSIVQAQREQEAALRKAQYLMSKDPSLSPEAAQALAADPKVFADLIKNKTEVVNTNEGVFLIDSKDGKILKRLGSRAKGSMDKLADVLAMQHFAESAQKGGGKGVADVSIETINNAPKVKDALEAAMKSVKDGIYTGFWGPVMEQVSSTTGGLIGNRTKLINTQQFRSYIGHTVLPLMKALGGSDSNEELRKMTLIAGGDTSLEEETILQILEKGLEWIDKRTKEAEENLSRATKGQLPTPVPPRASQEAPASSNKVVDWNSMGGKQ